MHILNCTLITYQTRFFHVLWVYLFIFPHFYPTKSDTYSNEMNLYEEEEEGKKRSERPTLGHFKWKIFSIVNWIVTESVVRTSICIHSKWMLSETLTIENEQAIASEKERCCHTLAALLILTFLCVSILTASGQRRTTAAASTKPKSTSTRRKNKHTQTTRDKQQPVRGVDCSECSHTNIQRSSAIVHGRIHFPRRFSSEIHVFVAAFFSFVSH